MKLVSYLKDEHEQLAMLVEGYLYNADEVHPELPSTMGMFLNYWDDYFPLAKSINESIIKGKVSHLKAVAADEVKLLAPVTQPTSLRDGYAFRQHVAAARRNRKVEMIPEFDQFPVFYF